MASRTVPRTLPGAVVPIIGIGSTATGMSQPRSASQLSVHDSSITSGDTGVMRNEYGWRRRTSSRPKTMSRTSSTQGESAGSSHESWMCLLKARCNSALYATQAATGPPAVPLPSTVAQ